MAGAASSAAATPLLRSANVGHEIAGQPLVEIFWRTRRARLPSWPRPDDPKVDPGHERGVDAGHASGGHEESRHDGTRALTALVPHDATVHHGVPGTTTRRPTTSAHRLAAVPRSVRAAQRRSSPSPADQPTEAW